MVTKFILAFVVGGLFCTIGQLLFETTKLTMGHIMVLFTVSGSVLTGLGLYEPLVKLAGAGASIPVSNFGFVLTQGVLKGLKETGAFGALSGLFEIAGAAIGAAIVFGFIFALLTRAKG
jgi:stage V sporulation protein AE